MGTLAHMRYVKTTRPSAYEVWRDDKLEYGDVWKSKDGKWRWRCRIGHFSGSNGGSYWNRKGAAGDLIAHCLRGHR